MKIEMNPFKLFTEWYNEEIRLTKVRIPSACCLSSIGLDNFPNSRFVSLKEVVNDAFIITGPLTSRKGDEISNSNKIALSFWWTETEKQVRIQGEATKISEQMANRYFSERSLDAKLISIVSNQGKEIEDLNTLNQEYQEAAMLFNNKNIPRPENWGGYSIKPIRIEFMKFSASRFHTRLLYEFINNEWAIKHLQP